MQYGKSGFKGKLCNGFDNFGMHRRVTDNAFFADIFLSRLKLRFNQANRLTALAQECKQHRQNNF